MPARASTRSMPSRPRLPAACPTRRCSATISSKASSPAPASCPISRWSRNFPPATTSLRRATTVGRAATGSCCRGCRVADQSPAPIGPGRRPGDRPLEDCRQSAANSVRAGPHAVVAGRIGLAARRRIGVDRLHTVDDPAADTHSGRRRRLAAPCRDNGRSHLRALGTDLRLAFAQWALVVTFLGHQAWLMGDAIVRTLVRLLVTRRHLLEWVPAAQAAIGPGSISLASIA